MPSPRLVLSLLGLLTAATAGAAPCPPEDLFNTRAAQVTAGKLMFCEPTAHDCWTYDADHASWALGPFAPTPTVTVSETGIEACSADHASCTQIPTTAFANGQAAVSDDGGLIAAWNGAKLEVYDTHTRKRVTSIKAWKSPMGSAKDSQIGGARFVGDALAVFENWSPVTSAARLYDPRKGKRLGDVVKAGAEIEPWAVLVDGTTWAFAGFDGKLYLVDVRTGKAKRHIQISATAGGKVLPGKLADGRLVVVGDGVTLVDLATGKVGPTWPTPACK
jgi:outer membrane protein assembly factor BamB